MKIFGKALKCWLGLHVYVKGEWLGLRADDNSDIVFAREDICEKCNHKKVVTLW